MVNKFICSDCSYQWAKLANINITCGLSYRFLSEILSSDADTKEVDDIVQNLKEMSRIMEEFSVALTVNLQKLGVIYIYRDELLPSWKELQFGQFGLHSVIIGTFRRARRELKKLLEMLEYHKHESLNQLVAVLYRKSGASEKWRELKSQLYFDNEQNTAEKPGDEKQMRQRLISRGRRPSFTPELDRNSADNHQQYTSDEEREEETPWKGNQDGNFDHDNSANSKDVHIEMKTERKYESTEGQEVNDLKFPLEESKSQPEIKTQDAASNAEAVGVHEAEKLSSGRIHEDRQTESPGRGQKTEKGSQTTDSRRKEDSTVNNEKHADELESEIKGEMQSDHQTADHQSGGNRKPEIDVRPEGGNRNSSRAQTPENNLNSNDGIEKRRASHRQMAKNSYNIKKEKKITTGEKNARINLRRNKEANVVKRQTQRKLVGKKTSQKKTKARKESDKKKNKERVTKKKLKTSTDTNSSIKPKAQRAVITSNKLNGVYVLLVGNDLDPDDLHQLVQMLHNSGVILLFHSDTIPQFLVDEVDLIVCLATQPTIGWHKLSRIFDSASPPAVMFSVSQSSSSTDISVWKSPQRACDAVLKVLTEVTRGPEITNRVSMHEINRLEVNIQQINEQDSNSQSLNENIVDNLEICSLTPGELLELTLVLNGRPHHIQCDSLQIKLPQGDSQTIHEILQYSPSSSNPELVNSNENGILHHGNHGVVEDLTVVHAQVKAIIISVWLRGTVRTVILPSFYTITIRSNSSHVKADLAKEEIMSTASTKPRMPSDAADITNDDMNIMLAVDNMHQHHLHHVGQVNVRLSPHPLLHATVDD